MTLGDRLRALLGVGVKEASIFEDLEEALIEGDIGPRNAIDIVENLKTEVKQGHLKEKDEFISALKRILESYIKTERAALSKNGLNFFLILGVNGVGKTTTVAKLADYYRRTYGVSKIILSAGDTFRAAAIDQLKIHGERLDLKVIHHEQGADPGAVIFDTITSALAAGTELVLADTAGRLHNKEHLVKELAKIDKIVSGRIQNGTYKKMLVIDATTGQNAYKQAETFKEAVHVDTIMLSKYDSTAKGGIVIPICRNLGIPFSFMGTGEKITDLIEFDTKLYLDSLVG
jgi:fused signal recognition particle receptor